MSRRNVSGFQKLDWVTFSLYLSLVGVGWLMIFTVSFDESQSLSDLIFTLDTHIGKQTLFIGASFLILVLILFIDYNFWRTFAYLIYASSLILLILVLIFGIQVKGATSWFSLFGFTFQPSELAKFGTCLALAAYLSRYNTNIKMFQTSITALGLIAVPIVLILLQPDAGSAIVFLSFLIVLYRAGFSPGLYIFGFSAATIFILGLVYEPVHIIIGLILFCVFTLLFQRKNKIYWFGALIPLIALSWSLTTKGYALYILALDGLILTGLAFLHYQERKTSLIRPLIVLLVLGALFSFTANYLFNRVLENHQRDRINVWLQPSKCDPQGALYNVLQSKMAIGSGGPSGKGFLEGTMTKLNYIPEQATDFIFCTIGEEQGFVGTIGIVGLFFLLIYRITVLAERQRSDFARHYAYGVAGVLFIHFFVNIGMTMGLVPIIGIPLPFISYGGSSILGFTILMAVLLSLDSNRFTA